MKNLEVEANKAQRQLEKTLLSNELAEKVEVDIQTKTSPITSSESVGVKSTETYSDIKEKLPIVGDAEKKKDEETTIDESKKDK